MEVVPLVLLIAVVFLGMGLIQLFWRDLAWEFTQTHHGFFGIKTERFPLWDMWRVVSGVMSIGAAVGLAFIAWKAVDVQRERDAEEKREAVAGELDTDFIDVIGILEMNATTEPKEISAAALGVTDSGSATVYYGTCLGRDIFYVLVVDHWDGLGNVAYSGSSRTFCLPEDLRSMVGDEEVIGESAFGGRWFKL